MSTSRRALNLNQFLLGIQQNREWTENDLINKITDETKKNHHAGISLRINLGDAKLNYKHDAIKKLNTVFKQVSPYIYYLNIYQDFHGKSSDTFWMGQILNGVNLSYTVLTLYNFSLKGVYQLFQDIDNRPCLARSVRFLMHPAASKQEARDIADLITSEYSRFYSNLSLAGYEKNSIQKYFTQQLAKFSRLKKIPLDTISFSKETPNLKERFEQFYYKAAAPLATASSATAHSASATHEATINALNQQIQALHYVIMAKTEENDLLRAENTDLNLRLMTSEYNQAVLLAQYGSLIDSSQQLYALATKSESPTVAVVVPNTNSVASMLYRNVFVAPANAAVMTSESHSVEASTGNILNKLR